ncbi:MAG: hypothetical protein ACI9Y1_003013 [Lentisphaeria bacterium]
MAELCRESCAGSDTQFYFYGHDAGAQSCRQSSIRFTANSLVQSSGQPCSGCDVNGTIMAATTGIIGAYLVMLQDIYRGIVPFFSYRCWGAWFRYGVAGIGVLVAENDDGSSPLVVRLGFILNSKNVFHLI